MLNKPMTRRNLLRTAALAAGTAALSGCSGTDDGKVEIEAIIYKQEATDVFEALQDEFNATHDDISVKLKCPSDATTVMKTRFTREDYPDIVAIGGDEDFSNFMDAEVLADVSDFEGLDQVKESYLDILETLKYVPFDGVYGVPYVSNAAGVLYNKDMFEEHGWEVPTTWDEFTSLLDQIQSEGVLPFYFGFKDTWTCLAPWNAIVIQLTPEDLADQVNAGEAVFSDYYREPAEKLLKLVEYGEDGPVAYGYNDACTAFANGQSAMYTIGSYAVPQILSVNPDMNIDSFVMPVTETADERILNSGVDLQFCVCKESEHKAEALEVISFLMEQENVQAYVDDQSAIPCLEGTYELSSAIDGMRSFLDDGNVRDFADHKYPSAMSADAMLQTMIIDGDVDAFLEKFDSNWTRYNRDVIEKVQDYNESQE